MHSQTKGAIISHGFNLISEIAKEQLVRREEQRQIDQEVEMQKQLVEARDTASPTPRAGDVSSQSTAGSDPQRDRSPEPDHPDGGDPDPQERFGPAEPRDPTEALEKASETVSVYDDMLETAYEMEDCQQCRNVIQATRDMPLPKQRQVLPELRDFIAAADQGAGAETLKGILRDSDHLLDVVKQSQPQQ